MLPAAGIAEGFRILHARDPDFASKFLGHCRMDVAGVRPQTVISVSLPGYRSIKAVLAPKKGWRLLAAHSHSPPGSKGCRPACS